MSEVVSKELFFDENDVIVSITDPKGVITYGNDIFFQMAESNRQELIGKPHNVIRHPDMPKVVFKLIWDRIKAGKEVYGFVKNQSKKGNYYWVYAFLKPVVEDGKVTKIISYRKQLNEYAKKVIANVYSTLVEYEKMHTLDESMQFLLGYLNERNIDYDTFIERLALRRNVTNIQAMKIDFQRYYNDHIIFKENIFQQVRENVQNITVTPPCSCNFGKWLESVKHESFTTHKAWAEVVRYHNHVHGKLQDYVNVSKQNGSEEQKRAISNEISDDTNQIFSNIRLVMNQCE